MALALAVQVVVNEMRGRRIKYKVTPTGSYPTGGDTADFTTATNPLNLPGAFISFPPVAAEVNFQDSLAGADAEYVVGALLTNSKIKLWSSAGNEHANGVYTAGELADVLYMEVFVSKGK